MNTTIQPSTLIIDKEYLRRQIQLLNLQMDIVDDPTASAEKAQAMSIAEGIHPEGNILSCGIIAARDEE